MTNQVGMRVDIETRAFERAMKHITKEGIPKAAAEALNRTADAVTKNQIRIVKAKLTLRTPYTLKSMESGRAKPFHALNKAKGKNIDRMFSRAGTFSSYLWKQEDGGRFGSESGSPVPIATDAARTGRNIRKPVAKRFRLGPGALPEGEYGDDGKMFIGQPRGDDRRTGLYVRSPNGKKLTMLRNMESEDIHIEPVHFHQRSVEKYGSGRYTAEQYKKAAEEEIRKAVRGVV